MVMVRHEAIGYDINQIRFAIMAQLRYKVGPVFVIEENRLAAHATVVQVVVMSSTKLVNLPHGNHSWLDF
jgi:hypothetical protein